MRHWIQPSTHPIRTVRYSWANMTTPTDKAKPVPPEITHRKRRRKIPLACEPCRERKSRCDGAKPICSGCHRRSLKLEDCVYTLDNARTASKDEWVFCGWYICISLTAQ